MLGGVPKKSFTDGLYLLGTATGLLCPARASPHRGPHTAGRPSPIAASPTGTTPAPWHASCLASTARWGCRACQAPLLVQNGWTDDLFPAVEAVRADRAYRGLKGARVSLQLGDLGHSRGANKVNSDRFFNDQGAAFFAAHLKGQGTPPRHRSVTAFTQTCPKGAPGGGPFRARNWERLHPNALPFGAFRVQRISSSGGNPDTALAFDKNNGGDPCASVAAERARGTAIAQSRFVKATTMLGLPTVRARIRTRGRGGMIAARLWDVFRGRQTLISRGVYRLTDNQKGKLVFQLFGNGWRFGKGHVAKLELLGSDPNFLRPSNNRFSVRVTNLTVELPTR